MYDHLSHEDTAVYHRIVSASIFPRAIFVALRIAVVLTLALIVAIAPSTVAYAQATAGSIAGTATDAQGAALPSVNITARNADTGTSRTVVSGSGGRYRIPALPTGTYNLTAQRDGFAKSQINGIVVTVNLEYERDLVLKVGGVDQAVSVTAQQSQVDTASSEVGSAIFSSQQVDNLPIAGRQATQLSLLLPTTTTDTTRTQRPDANVGFGSQNVAATNYLVDGLTNMISGAGDPRDNIQQAAIQEFKVIISQTQAEYGGRSGGVVTLVTKSGTNKIHGEAFEFFRDHYINRVDYYTQTQHDSDPSLYPIAPFSRNQFGFSVGGPLIKDKLHYFGTYERLDDREYFTVAPGGTAPPTSVINGQTVQDYGSQEGSFRDGSLQNSVLLRTDWQINARHTAFLKFFQQSPSVFYCLGCSGGNSSNYSVGDTAVPGWTWAAGETWIISPSVVNQFGAQVAQDWQTSAPSHFYTPSATILAKANSILTTPADVPAGIVAASGASTQYKFPNFSWGFNPSTQFHPFYQEVFDALTVTYHTHTFKVGGDVLNQPRKTQAVANPLGAWTFTNDIYFNPTDPNFNWASLINAVPKSFTLSYPTIPYINYNLESAVYAQDEWQILPNLTLNLGVRYDLQTKVWVNSLHESIFPSSGLPAFVHLGGHGVYDNVAPRIGFVWDPQKNGKTAIRAGYGIVYTMNSNNIYGTEVSTLRLTTVTNTKPTSIVDPFNGKGYESYYLSTPPAVSVNDNNVSNPPVYTWNLGATRQLNSYTALIVDGFYSKMTKFQLTNQVNAPLESSFGTPTSNTNPVFPYPAYAGISDVQSLGNYEYKALAVRLDKRYSHHHQFTASYTLAKQRDNYNGTGFTDIYYPQADKGWAAADRRNSLVLSGSTRIPFKVTVGAIYTLRSALPFSATYSNPNILPASTGYTEPAIYVPGTFKNQHSKASLLKEVNAWRATQTTSVTIGGVKTTVPLGNIPASQIQSNFYNQLDLHINKDINFGDRYKLQLIGQLFNVFGTDNFGGVGSSQQGTATGLSPTSPYVSYATSTTSFGTISAALPRQQAELAVRFVF